MTAERLFRIEEGAALRGESYGATRAAIARGELRTVRVGVRGVRIPESELSKASAKDPERVQEPTATATNACTSTALADAPSTARRDSKKVHSTAAGAT